MDGYVLVLVGDAAAEGGDALSLQTCKEHLLSYAVGLQTLAVNVEAYLLLLSAVYLDVGN